MSEQARKEFDYLVYGDWYEDAEGNPIDRALLELDKIQAGIDAKYPKPTGSPSSRRAARRFEDWLEHERAKGEPA